MARFDWHKREHRAALIGMKGLPLELRGAYNTILDLIYDTEDNLADDDRYLAGWMNVGVRHWRHLKGQLVELGKITVEDGLIHNRKASAVVSSAKDRHLNTVHAARVGAAKRWPNSNKNNDLFQADVKADALQSQIKRKNKTYTDVVRSHLSTELSTAPTRTNGHQDPNKTAVDTFSKAVAPHLPGPPQQQWNTLLAASQPSHPKHAEAIVICFNAATQNGIQYPSLWPKPPQPPKPEPEAPAPFERET